MSSRPLKPPLTEISGIAHHLSLPNHYWAHNDSLDQARLFLLNQTGKLISEYRAQPNDNIQNIDWEDITSVDHDPYEGKNVLYIADSGNNFHWRDHLTVYAFEEPQATHKQLHPLSIYPYRFPHQSSTPPLHYQGLEGRCLDSEALFWWQGELFLIGKCVFGGQTQVWRLPRENRSLQSKNPKESHLNKSHNKSHNKSQIKSQIKVYQELTLISSAILAIQPDDHPLLERVTGAAVHPQINILAVLTYQSVWFFQLNGTSKVPQPHLLFRCLLTQASAQPVRQAEAIEWVFNHQDDMHSSPQNLTSYSSNLSTLLILTEGQGVHSLSLDLNHQECL